MKKVWIILFVLACNHVVNAGVQCPRRILPWSLQMSAGYGVLNQLRQKNTRNWPYILPYEINLGTRYSNVAREEKSVWDLGLSYAKYVGFYSGPSHSESRAVVSFLGLSAGYGRLITLVEERLFLTPLIGVEAALQTTRKNWMSGMGEIENYEVIQKIKLRVPIHLDLMYDISEGVLLGLYVDAKLAKKSVLNTSNMPDIYTNAGVKMRLLLYGQPGGFNF